MNVNTNALTDAALDWAVAKIEGYRSTTDGINQLVEKGEKLMILGRSMLHGQQIGYSPSTDWGQGGPIIERANITIIRANDDYETDAAGFTINTRIPQWFAETDRWVGHSTAASYEGEYMEPTFMIGEAGGYYGPTPLIAAMRCFCASRLGDVVEVPDEIA
jgi:hypothetical protein